MIARCSAFAVLSRCLRMFVICACAAAALNGCGKTGNPVAPDKSGSFAWQETDAQPAGRCIAFSGSFSGSYRHFNGIRLELQAMADAEDCPGCPFVADEAVELSPREAGFDPDNGTVAFAYCPGKSAPVYRWRMSGISEYSRMPHAAMLTDRLLVLQP